MKLFTANEIQAQFEKLPKEVQTAITSTEINDKIEALAKKHNLLIDQTGELVDEIGLTMMGLSKSADFVDHIITRCSINRKNAEDIATDINREIFDSIRQHMRQIEEKVEREEIKPQNINQAENDNSALERAGDFEILSESGSESIRRNDANSRARNYGGGKEEKNEEVNRETKNVENIENDNLLGGPTGIVVTKEKVVPEASTNLPVEKPNIEEPATTPLVENSVTPPPTLKPPQKGYVNDPYREPF